MGLSAEDRGLCLVPEAQLFERLCLSWYAPGGMSRGRRSSLRGMSPGKIKIGWRMPLVGCCSCLWGGLRPRAARLDELHFPVLGGRRASAFGWKDVGDWKRG